MDLQEKQIDLFECSVHVMYMLMPFYRWVVLMNLVNLHFFRKHEWKQPQQLISAFNWKHP